MPQKIETAKPATFTHDKCIIVTTIKKSAVIYVLTV